MRDIDDDSQLVQLSDRGFAEVAHAAVMRLARAVADGVSAVVSEMHRADAQLIKDARIAKLIARAFPHAAQWNAVAGEAKGHAANIFHGKDFVRGHDLLKCGLHEIRGRREVGEALDEAQRIAAFFAPRYLAELKKGPDMLNYRRFPLSKIPENLRPFAMPFVQQEADPKVVVLDNRLDGVFGHLPGWASDRHPNLAGYNVIADETAKWLATIIRGVNHLPTEATTVKQ